MGDTVFLSIFLVGHVMVGFTRRFPAATTVEFATIRGSYPVSDDSYSGYGGRFIART